MCVVCGCAGDGTQVAMDGHAHVHAPGPYSPAARRAKPGSLAPRRAQSAWHEAAHMAVDPASGDLHFGAGAAKVSVPGMSQARAIRLEADILGENDRVAAHNRAQFAAHGVTALNFVSSPGSGKTTLLCATIEALKSRAPGLPLAVIEGDQQTSFDADRIRATGAPALQINTGKGCHLDAPMVAEAFARLNKHPHHGRSLLFIENVGNLVCPAMWDLGEAAKVAILSVTEGEDKPLKYPDMFAASSLMLVNKVDLLPWLKFDVERCIAFARRVNPSIEVIRVSATTGEGMSDWLDWISARLATDAPAGHPLPVADRAGSAAS
ncbi:MAG TPA: hydrogenase nickel incorporation protein HypB [Methyloversatilis sp.]